MEKIDERKICKGKIEIDERKVDEGKVKEEEIIEDTGENIFIYDIDFPPFEY